MSETPAVIEPTQAATPAPAAAPPALSADPQVEARARRMGWVPREQFRGDGGAQWIDAATFVDRAEVSMPILVERNRQLDARAERNEAELAATRSELTGIKTMLDETRQVMDEFRTFASRGEERAYARARRELDARMTSAVEQADTGAFAVAKAELQELEESHRPAAPTPRTAPPPATTPAAPPPAAPVVTPPAATQPPPHPDVTEWMRENEWFMVGSPTFSPMLNGAAVEEDSRLSKEVPGLSIKERLGRVTENVRRRFPEKFGITENPARQQPAAVGGATTPAPPQRRDKHTFENLPQEAKDACIRFEKMIPNFKRDEYLAQYDWDDE